MWNIWNIKYYDCFLECKNFKDDLTEYKCLCWNKYQQKKFYEKLNEQVFITCKYSDHDNNKFFLLLWKGVWTYEYMDD